MKNQSSGRRLTSGVLQLSVGLCALSLFLGVSGCMTDGGYRQTAAEREGDLAISSQVVAALNGDTQYKYGGVTVKTLRGKVELKGFVNSRDQKNRAGDHARNVAGVTEVVNLITVQESAK